MKLQTNSGTFFRNAPVMMGVAGLLLGLIIGYFTGSSAGRSGGSDEVDFDNDGRPDVVWNYEKGLLVSVRVDRNFDGKDDYYEWYRDGRLSRVETDDNFDGKIDRWMECERGNVSFSREDADFNGIPDLFQHWEHGLPRVAIWRPNESKEAIRVEIFTHGFKTGEFLDHDGDGLLETERSFDSYGQQIKEETLEKKLGWKELVDKVVPGRNHGP